MLVEVAGFGFRVIRGSYGRRCRGHKEMPLGSRLEMVTVSVQKACPDADGIFDPLIEILIANFIHSCVLSILCRLEAAVNHSRNLGRPYRCL